MASRHIPQNSDSLDANVSTTENGRSNLWIGEFFNGQDGTWRGGTRSFYLPMTTQEDRDKTARFLRYIADKYVQACESIPVSEPTAAPMSESRSGFAEYLANTRNGPVKTTKAPAPKSPEQTVSDDLRASLSGNGR
jgi:hypothetical protein